jgi:aminopeptidase N
VSRPSVAPHDTYLPQHGDPSYDVQHYALDLAYVPRSNRLTAVAEITLVLRAPARAVSLDLSRLQVTKAAVDGRPAKFGHRGTKLVVRLDAPGRAGQRLVVRLKYGGQPTPLVRRWLGEAGWEELTDGVIVAAQPHGAPTWFPCNDRVDDKATYAVRVTVPADYTVAFSGESLRERRTGATRTWEFEQTAPMATYLATLQIGHYEVRPQHGPVPMRVLVPADIDPDSYAQGFGRQPQMMRFFADRFGPYPFSSYTTVVTDDVLEIPLESQSLSTFGRNFCSGEWENVRLVAHELAHQWFGNAVTADRWQHIWLHEGFACYAEWLWSEESGEQSADQRARGHHRRLSGLAQDLLLGDPGPQLMFDDRVYKRGALTLHAIRLTVGDEVFFAMLRQWVTQHRGGSVTTDDFTRLCVDTGGPGLGRLLDAWVWQHRLPALPDRNGVAAAG